MTLSKHSSSRRTFIQLSGGLFVAAFAEPLTGCGNGSGGPVPVNGTLTGTAGGRSIQIGKQLAVYIGSNSAVTDVRFGNTSGDINMRCDLPPVTGPGSYPLATAFPANKAPLLPYGGENTPGLSITIAGQAYFSRYQNGSASVTASIDSVTGSREGGRIKGSFSGTLYQYQLVPSFSGAQLMETPTWYDDKSIQANIAFDLPTADSVQQSAASDSGGTTGGTIGGAYSGSKASQVHTLLGKIPVSQRLPTGAGDQGVPPDLSGYAGPCVRDSYIAAAMLTAWAVEAGARQGKPNAQLAPLVDSMISNLQQANALCGGGPSFEGGQPCSTLKLISCSDLTSLLR
jgi:hypothetical protein